MLVEVGQTLLDAVILSANSMEDLFTFCALNNLGYTDNITPGASLQATGLSYVPSSVPSYDYITVKPVNVMLGQTIMDMATQQVGSIEGMFALAALNNMAYSDGLAAGQSFNYGTTAYNAAMLQIFKANNYKPATGTTLPAQQTPVIPSGIGYWGISFDFVVQ